MARRSGRKQRERGGGGGRSWWWLALPAIGLAAYAAFDATLGLVSSDDATQDPPAVTRDTDRAATTSLGDPQPAVAPATQEPLAADPAVAAPVASEPAPSPTAADARSADAGSVKTKPKAKKAAPKESLTEQDRKALDRVIERATKQQAR